MGPKLRNRSCAVTDRSFIVLSSLHSTDCGADLFTELHSHDSP